MNPKNAEIEVGRTDTAKKLHTASGPGVERRCDVMLVCSMKLARELVCNLRKAERTGEIPSRMKRSNGSELPQLTSLVHRNRKSVGDVIAEAIGMDADEFRRLVVVYFRLRRALNVAKRKAAVKVLADSAEHGLRVLRPHALRSIGKSRLVSIVEQKLSNKERVRFTREAALVLWDRLGGPFEQAYQHVDDLLKRSRQFQLDLKRAAASSHERTHR